MAKKTVTKMVAKTDVLAFLKVMCREAVEIGLELWEEAPEHGLFPAAAQIAEVARMVQGHKPDSIEVEVPDE